MRRVNEMHVRIGSGVFDARLRLKPPVRVLVERYVGCDNPSGKIDVQASVLL
jgi:hypothetical protein